MQNNLILVRFKQFYSIVKFSFKRITLINNFFSLTDTTAPLIYSVHKVVTKEGSNVTLTCLGDGVEKIDTRIMWKFNGHEIQRNTNKERTAKFLDKQRGSFSLYIKNVSEKDVGTYTCLAKVSFGGGKTLDAEDYMYLELSHNEEGEFPLLLLFS